MDNDVRVGNASNCRTNRRAVLAQSGKSVAVAGLTLALGRNPTVARAAAGLDEASPTLTVVSNWPVIDFDPHSLYEGGSAQAMTGVFEGLIKLRPGSTSEFEPSLAESWESNDDQSAWTFHLRPNVQFHDGTPLDANAAHASFERLFALALPPSTVLGRFIQSIDQIQVVDSQTLRFDLGRPQMLFETAMATPFGTAIVNAALAKSHEVDGDWGHTWAQTDSTGMGTGPYQATRSESDDSVELTRFDAYWGGWTGSHFDQVTLRTVTDPATRRELIERGDAGLVFNLPLTAVEDLEQNPDVSVVRATTLGVQYFAMTVAGPLADPTARRALCWAFPYDEVLSGVLLDFAKPARGPVNENCRGFAATATTYQTDLDMARQLLDEAGVEPNAKLSVAVANGNPENQAIAELFQANLKKIDVDLEIQNLDIAAYVQMAFGDLPAEERVSFFPSSWGPDYDDAYNHLWPLLSCDGWHSGNAGQFCDDHVEELLSTARDADDNATYDAALAEIQQIVTGENPAGIYFAQPEWITVLRPNVGGFVMSEVSGSLLDYYALHPL
jgi:peptide/nickel transport system substrate-binding protein